MAGKWSNGEAFVGFVLCLSVKMKEVKITWIADSKASVERKTMKSGEQGVMNYLRRVRGVPQNTGEVGFKQEGEYFFLCN